jgi:putative DNA primase/helicase
MLPKHPENPRYWDDLEALKLLCYIINGIPCLVLTEGFFKAICEYSNDIPTIAVLGDYNGERVEIWEAGNQKR